MKILFYNFSLPYLLSKDSDNQGGIAVEWLNWINAFRQLNQDVALLTFKGAKKIINSEVDFEIIESYDPKYGLPKLRILYVQIPSIIRDIKKYNPDIILQGGANLHCVIMGICSKLTNKKFIHRIASDADVDKRIIQLIDVDGRINQMGSGFELFIYRHGRKLVDGFSVQNDYQYNVLSTKYPDKIVFKIYNPYKPCFNNPLKPKEERKFVAWVGHFRKIKNIVLLAHICSQLNGLNFKVAGIPYDDLPNESRNALERMKNMENVEFVGYVEYSKIQNFLSNAYCLLNTSFLEGFSNTYLEAWSVGTPIVTTNRADPDNLIEKYRLGLVVHDFDNLTLELKKIINYSDLEYSELSLRCYEYVRKEHDPIFLAKKFITQIEKLIRR
jgi:glycosyltransferase involved in cell wall biosynthesis